MSEYYFSSYAPAATSVADAVAMLRHNLNDVLAGHELPEPVFVRFFCSDVCNQAPVIERLWPSTGTCQRLYIGQQPLDSRYLSLQAYCIDCNAQRTEESDGSLLVRHGKYESLWSMDYPAFTGNSEKQTDQIIHSLQSRLESRGMNLESNVMRTWYYLRDIDNNYAGMIKSRVLHYEASGLDACNHFIASTGIEARSPDPHTLVALQSHAIKGLLPAQVTYLKALDYLSPTASYGVNFERATKIVYGDRRHCHISGKASIDKHGNVLHKGNVARQMERALENMEALLEEGGMGMNDMRCATIYLRDSEDIAAIMPVISSRLPADCARNITAGAVCRPEWLVEIEGEVIKYGTVRFAPFSGGNNEC